MKEENEVAYYSDKKNTDLEDKVTTWDMSAEDLQTFYDDARFENFLDWEYDDVTNVDGKRQCKKVSLKRRIPWLYPEDGTFFTNIS